MRVYAAQSLDALESNCLTDIPFITLHSDDKQLLSTILGYNYLWHQRTFTSLSEGLFVEVRPQKGSPFGYYMTSKGYTPIPYDITCTTYSYTRKKKAIANKLIKKYQQLLPQTSELIRYDHLPMESSLPSRPIRCMMYPGTWNWAYFFVQKDSSFVKPFLYIIGSKKKKGNLIVSRTIPLFTSYNRNVTQMGISKDSLAVEMINKLIPGWNDMSDPERMRFLDSCINNK